MTAKYEYVRPVELVVEDQWGRETRTTLLSMEVSSGDDLAPRWVKLKVQHADALTSKGPPRAAEVINREEHAFLQALDSEPQLSMLAMADWYQENAPPDPLYDRLCDGLRALASQQRMPLAKGRTYRWMPLPPGETLGLGAHYLPAQVYDTLPMTMRLRFDWPPGSNVVLEEHQRNNQIVRAAVAWGMASDGVGAAERSEPNVSEKDVRLLRAIRRLGGTAQAVWEALRDNLGWTAERYAAADAACADPQGPPPGHEGEQAP